MKSKIALINKSKKLIQKTCKLISLIFVYFLSIFKLF